MNKNLHQAVLSSNFINTITHCAPKFCETRFLRNRYVIMYAITHFKYCK